MGRPITCHCGDCKKCKHRVYMRGWYERNPGYANALRAKDPEYKRDIERQWYAKKKPVKKTNNPEKQSARHKAWCKLDPKPCEDCGSFPRGSDGRRLVHAHHEDYSQPLAVTWLCSVCHGKRHRQVA